MLEQGQTSIPPQDNEHHESDDDKEIIIPAELVAERINSFTQIIGKFVRWDPETMAYVRKDDAPKVDRFIVPYRSGPIAIAGLESLLADMGIKIGKDGLFPAITYVHGLGYEILHAFENDPKNAAYTEDGMFSISDYGVKDPDDESDERPDYRAIFWDWIKRQPPESPVAKFVEELKNSIEPGETVALLDDTYSEGTTSGGVFTGMKIAAFGPKVKYAIQYNEFIFPKNTGWIKAIIESTYGKNLDLDRRDGLINSAKGGSDSILANYTPVNGGDNDIHTKLTQKMESLSKEAKQEIENKLRAVSQ